MQVPPPSDRWTTSWIERCVLVSQIRTSRAVVVEDDWLGNVDLFFPSWGSSFLCSHFRRGICRWNCHCPRIFPHCGHRVSILPEMYVAHFHLFHHGRTEILRPSFAIWTDRWRRVRALLLKVLCKFDGWKKIVEKRGGGPSPKSAAPPSGSHGGLVQVASVRGHVQGTRQSPAWNQTLDRPHTKLWYPMVFLKTIKRNEQKSPKRERAGEGENRGIDEKDGATDTERGKWEGNGV